MPFRPAHFEGLLKFLRRKGRSREDAEDLIQEAMLRLHVYGREALVTVKESFLRHTVHNLSVDQHRRERPDLRTQVPFEHLDTQGSPITLEPTLEGHPRGAATPEPYQGGAGCREPAYAGDIFRKPRRLQLCGNRRHMGISHITIKRHIARALLAIMEHIETEEDAIANRPTK